MAEKSYSQKQLYKIAADNYRILRKFCDLLSREGYWETPEQVLKTSAQQILDLYAESLLVCFAKYCDRLTEGEKTFIAALSETAGDLIRNAANDNKLVEEAERIQRTPPILFQLLSLRDMEKSSGTAALFFDAIINIMLCLVYNMENRPMPVATKYLGMYFDKVSTFLTNNKNSNQCVDSKYIFKKLCHGELSESAEQLEAADCDFEKYKILHLYYTPEQLRPVASAVVEDVESLSVKHPAQAESSKEPSEEKKENEEDKKTENIVERIRDSRLDELMEELNSLVGLSDVKREIRSLINLIKVRKMREEFKLPQIEMSYHMVFTGSPGTGKTTVARIVGNIYKELGILSKGTVTETDRSGLVAGYVGQTALKVKEVVEKSLGGVLFIDEAYALANNTANDFGGEALDTLVKLMEDHRNDLVVIVAGYTDEMKKFLKSNTGLVSRFNRFISFPDYTDDELCEIMQGMAKKNGFSFREPMMTDLKEHLTAMSESERKEFGNARGIRNLFEAMIVNQANRVVANEICSMEELTEFVKEDASW
ncbi:MAG: AAA family ATPase [Lachnospiraceae bacterium]|nr:AAA family ATPase [Lachnospiraceae bacterium]